jgi:GAF domain-containing protein
MAWVGLVDEGTRMVKPICQFGNEAGYLNDIVISTDDVPAGRGPTGASIRGNCVSYVNDYATDERTLPWREAALARGFRGAAGVPLRFRNKVIGALTLYSDELNYFDAEQVSLLEEMAIDIGFALDNFAREAERKQAEIRLAEQLNELRRWHEATLGREMRILELKHEVNELLAHSGKPPRYSSAEADNKGNSIV